jgi:hypothetical protein
MSKYNARELANLYVEEVIHKYNPKFEIKQKSESKLFKAIKPILLLINPKFFKSYISTVFGTMWVTESFWTDSTPMNVLQVVAHEGVHEYDRKKLPPFVFELLYMFPHWLVVPFLVLAFMHSWWWLIPAVLSLSPGFAPGRFYLEMRGYSVERLWNKHIWLDRYDPNPHIIYQMSSIRTYWATWPFRRHISKKLSSEVDESDPAFKDVLDFLSRHDLDFSMRQDTLEETRNKGSQTPSSSL